MPRRKFSKETVTAPGGQELAVDIYQATGHQCLLSTVYSSKSFPLPPPVPLCWTPKIHNQQLVSWGGDGVRSIKKWTTISHQLQACVEDGQRFNQVKTCSFAPCPRFLRCNWYILLYTFQVCKCWFVTCMNCKAVITIVLATTFILSHSYQFLFCGENI